MTSTKKSFVKGVGYIAAAKYSGILISLLITSILARILTPEDFGIVAIATVFIVFFSLLSDMGIAPAIIQFKQLTKEDFSSIFGFTFWIALILAILFFLISSGIAHFYAEPKLINICRALSLQVFFATINIVPQALLLREKKFNVIAIRNISVQAFCGIIAITWACNGGGIYALLVSPILGSALTLLVNVLCMKLRIKLLFSIAPMKIISSYSLYQFLFNFVNYFGRNLDKIIIGKAISVSSLGYYEKSYRLMLMPVQNIDGVIAPVLHPYLSDSQNDINKIHDIFNRSTKILMNVGFLVAGCLFMCGRELILIVFGNQWEAAVSCFQILSLSVAIQIPMVTIGSFFQACNQTKLMFRVGLINTSVTILGLFIAAFTFRTIEAISVAFVITAIFSALNSFYAIYHFCFHTHLGVVKCMAIKPTLVLILMVLLSLAISTFDVKIGSILLSFLLKIFICGGISLIYLIFFTDFDLLSKARKVWEAKLKKS